MYEEYRYGMIESQIKARGINTASVLNAFAHVPRHVFVTEAMRGQAYDDHPLAIGEGQTISQPYIVALMTDAAEIKDTDKVLEIGTGCGYQTAILAELAKEVYTIERHASLSKNAQATLASLEYTNITFRIGNGFKGWPEAAPFDAIIVTAAPAEVPEKLLEQLAENGRLIIPVGERYQTLYKIIRENDRFDKYKISDVRFVPMIDKE